MKQYLFIFALLMVILFAGIMSAVAQDNTPVPTSEPVATLEAPAPDTVTTVTTTTTTPVNPDIGMTLNWALSFLAIWQSAGIAYAVAVEKTIKPTLYAIIGTWTDDVNIRKAVLALVVLAGAFGAVQQGGINLFADAPGGLFNNASVTFMLVLNAVFVASGAFMGAEIWITLESWLKKVKSVFDVLSRLPHAENTGSIDPGFGVPSLP